MSPPRIVFGEHLDIVVFIEFVGRQDAEFGTGAKENDRDHQGAGEIERVRPSESEIVGHREAPSGSGADPRSMAPCGRTTAAITEPAPAGRRHARVADPEAG